MPGSHGPVVEGSQVNSGHYVPIIGADTNYVYCVTWGKVQVMTREFLTTYCDEAYAILSEEFINGKGVSPEGFNLAQLQTDLQELLGVYPIPPDPNHIPAPPASNWYIKIEAMTEEQAVDMENIALSKGYAIEMGQCK